MNQSSSENLLSLVNTIRSTIETTSREDGLSHAKLLDEISALTLAAETPLDTIYRIGHQVGLSTLFDPSMSLLYSAFHGAIKTDKL